MSSKSKGRPRSLVGAIVRLRRGFRTPRATFPVRTQLHVTGTYGPLFTLSNRDGILRGIPRSAFEITAPARKGAPWA